MSPYWTVSPELADILIKYFGYDRATVKNHRKILELVTKNLDFVALLRDNYRHIIDTADNIPAYLYGMFKRKLSDQGISRDGTKAPAAQEEISPEE